MPFPLSALRIPFGRIAVTIFVSGAPQFSVVFAAERIEEVLRGIEQHFSMRPSNRSEMKSHLILRRGIAHVVRTMDSVEDRDTWEKTGIIGLWCALNHPTGGDGLRKATAEQLKSESKAHITVVCDNRDHWTFNLAKLFVDLGQDTEESVDGRLIMVLDPEPVAPPTTH